MRIIIIVLPLVLIVVGCSTHSQCQRELYQSRLQGATDEFITLHQLDRGESQKAHDFATSEITLRLDELHRLTNGADKDQLESGTYLAHSILKNAAEHREQLIQDKYSLQMVIECKNLVTNTVDIQRASELQQYLTSSSTNQILWETP
jgi:hypothetical protein